MPPRATRASANAKEASAGAAAAAETPGSKRKRRSSQDSPLKVVLPSPSAIAKANNASISASPDKVIGDADHESKRQKLSLKIHVHGAEKPQEVKIEKEIEGALSKEIREGLSVVIARCEFGGPKAFADVQDIIHIFSENLLAPVLYPNPVPARSQFHLPVPPLPPHFPSHAIYNFCASLHSLLLEIEPHGGEAGLVAERWGLMQKTPQGGEWFTGAADAREVEKRKGKESSEHLLEKLAESGVAFGELRNAEE
ncbi:uncharacterized protein I303_103684 [Kwoniella dejecticola CBS 10117]|uniref:Uncharacterized protein n=1 Tax=Kwoniella dejecticola CBS 10117 TaxID=1296121 RepID=A0AAJ8KP22_9TREE